MRDTGGALSTAARVSEATRGRGGGFAGVTVAVFLNGLGKLNDVIPRFVVAVDDEPAVAGFFRMGILLTDLDRLNLLNCFEHNDAVEFEVVSSLTILSGLLLR